VRTAAMTQFRLMIFSTRSERPPHGCALPGS